MSNDHDGHDGTNDSRSTNQDPWAPFVKGTARREDERERLLRYRAGYFAFVAITGLSYLFWLSGLAVDEHAFTLSAGDLQQIAFWVAVAGVGIFSLLHRPVQREINAETRVRLATNPGARRFARIYMASAFLFGCGMFFVVFHFLGEHEHSVGHSLTWAVGTSLGITLLGGGAFLRRASKRELEQAEN